MGTVDGHSQGVLDRRVCSLGLSGVSFLSRSLGTGEAAQTRVNRCPGEVEGRATRHPPLCHPFLDSAAQTRDIGETS